MTNIAIIDDNFEILNHFSNHFNNLQDIKIVNISTTVGNFFRSEINENQLDVLFLDIFLPEETGLQALPKIKEKYPKLPVVLVTAYMNYALDGYKVKASRFLLKDNLADTIEECMDDLIAEINKNRRILEFRFVEGTIKLYADDIIYIETELHKNVFYTEKGTFQIYKKLDELENELKNMGFVRAHLSFLVNMKYITKISSYVMTLTTG